MASTETEVRDQKIAIVGSGQIGRSWAMLFASGGYQVALYDINTEQVTDALEVILEQLESLKKQGLLRGSLTVQQQYANIKRVGSLAECVKDAVYIQECVLEKLELKLEVLKEIDSYAENGAIMASSTSSLLPSVLSEALTQKENFIVAHPTNPPFYARALELVPAPWTSSDTMKLARALMEQIGQKPIVLKKEIAGFVLNRMQYALVGESWRLVRDGVVSVEGLNKVMSSGLGMQYAFMGPFQMIHLNANGFMNYCERYGTTIHRVQRSFGPPEKMGGEAALKVQEELLKDVPLDKLQERRRWRERRMAALAKLNRDLDSEGSSKRAHESS